MNKELKALETISLGYTQGNVSIDFLIKACDDYRLQNGLINNEDYDLKVVKSLIDQLNGIEGDKNIVKAIVPGQTKYMDGILYVYSATKQGSKTEYGWHVARKSKVGKTSTVDDKAAKKLADEVNTLFPMDIKSVSIVKAVGGSTGAQLVKDAQGNQYIMKRATKVPAEHVRSEYIANMLYNILGQKTPDFELYDSDSDKDITMLSRFIPGTREPNQNDFTAMGHGFISDVLLANWDVFKNDNCRIDAGGNVIRVDNGASLFYRAQGALKNPAFDDDVVRTYKDMLRYNPMVAQTLDPKDLLKQIDLVMAKKSDIVNFLNESNQVELAKILSKRINNLKGIRDDIAREEKRKAVLAAGKVGKIPPRQLVPAKEMYAEIDEKELKSMLDEVVSQTGSVDSALQYNDSKIGWNLLSKICQKRGFDGRPNVVTEDDFWKLAAKSKHPIMIRGNANLAGKTAKEYCDMFRYDECCFFGQSGVWGQGIYAHTDDKNQKWLDDLQKANNKAGHYVDRNTIPYDPKDNIDNKSNQQNYKSTGVYIDALRYAGTPDGILKIAWEADAKVVDLNNLLEELKGDVPVVDPKLDAARKKLRKEMDGIKDVQLGLAEKVTNWDSMIEKEVKKNMHYDESAIFDMYDTIDNTTDWGNKDAQGKPNYPKFKDFVVKKMADWCIKNGGNVSIGPNEDYVEFKMNGQICYIAAHSWENNAILRKNAMTSAYCYPAERFKIFMETNCISVVDRAVKAAKESSKGKIKDIKDKMNDLENDWLKKKNEYDKLSNDAIKSDSLHGILYNKLKDVKSRDSGNTLGVIGIYAAMKGYDGIYVHNGNTSNHGFNVILNRTKVVTSID